MAFCSLIYYGFFHLCFIITEPCTSLALKRVMLRLFNIPFPQSNELFICFAPFATQTLWEGKSFPAAFPLLAGSYLFSLFHTKVFTVGIKPRDLAETHSIYQQWEEPFPSRAAYEDNNDGVLKANEFWLTRPRALKWCLFPQWDKLSHRHVCTGWRGASAHSWRLSICMLLGLQSSITPLIRSLCDLHFVWFFLFFHLSLLMLHLSVHPAGSVQECGPAGCSGVSGAAGLHAADGAGEADHGLLPAGVPGGTYRSGAAGHGSVRALQHTCKGTAATARCTAAL